MFLVSRIFVGPIFWNRFQVFMVLKWKRPSTAQSIICFNCLFPSVRTVDFDARILFWWKLLSIACVEISTRASSLACPAWSESLSPTQICVYPREFMTLSVAQFSLKMTHLFCFCFFSMVLRGPRAYGLRPRLWLLVRTQCKIRKFCMEIIGPKNAHISAADFSKQLIFGDWAFFIMLFPNM